MLLIFLALGNLYLIKNPNKHVWPLVNSVESVYIIVSVHGGTQSLLLKLFLLH